MKITDDHRAKARLWARQPTVVPLPPGPTLPRFPAQRFRTHAEMNRWKQSLLRELAQTMTRRG